MKRSFTVAVSLAALFAGTAIRAQAADMDVAGEVTARAASAFVWRGRPMNSDGVIQPEVHLDVGPFSLNVWATWDLQATEETPGRTRVDTSLDYTYRWNVFEFKGGAVVYAYRHDPAKSRDTCELYASAVANVAFLPSLIVYRDISQNNGFYAAASVTDKRSLCKDVDALLSARLGAASSGFNASLFDFSTTNPPAATVPVNVAKSAILDFDISLSVPVALPHNMKLTPRVDYVSLVDSDLRDAVEAADKKPDNLVATLALSWDF